MRTIINIVTSSDIPAAHHDGSPPRTKPAASAASVASAPSAIAAANDGDVVGLTEKLNTASSPRLKTQLQVEDVPMLCPDAP